MELISMTSFWVERARWDERTYILFYVKSSIIFKNKDRYLEFDWRQNSQNLSYVYCGTSSSTLLLPAEELPTELKSETFSYGYTT